MSVFLIKARLQFFLVNQVDSLLAKIQLSLLHISKEESLDQVNRSLCYHYLSHFNREHFAQNLVDRVDEARVLIELQKKSNSIRTASSSESQKAKESGKEPFDPFVYLFIIEEVNALMHTFHIDTPLMSTILQ